MATGWRPHVAGIALLLGAATPGRAEPALLCQRPEVLQEVARTLRQWNLYNTIDENSVTEAPTDRANAVICQITMTGTGYEAIPSGWRTRRFEEVRRYDVQVAGNRFFIQVQP